MKNTYRHYCLFLLSLLYFFQPAFSQSCPKPFKVVVLGSSTSAGYRVSADSAYVNLFREYLVNVVNPGCEVINLAVSGYNTYNMQPGWYTPPSGQTINFARNITAAIALKPDAILINFPSNDARDGIALSVQKANFERVAATADSAKIPIWVTSTQPRDLSTSKKAMLTVMRDWLRGFFGSRYIDFWTGLATTDNTIIPEYDSGDGTHFNGKGHEILFSRVVASSLVGEICAIVLPMEVGDFKLFKDGRSAVLQWQTSGLQYGTALKVEFSMNGQTNWETAVTIPVNMIDSANGSFQHKNAGDLATVLYYRIAAVNSDGLIKYSKIEKIQFESANLSKALAYVSGSTIEMHATSGELVQFVIYDYLGKPLQTGSFQQGGQTIQLFSKGIYIVKMRLKDGSLFTRKLSY